MKRRAFTALIGGTLASPLVARAQQQGTPRPVIGFLLASSPASIEAQIRAFLEGLRESGYRDGENVSIEFRWAEGDYARLPALARELVGQRVAVIATGGGPPPALAAKAATRDVPIVFVSGGDPVQLGLIASLNRPGGNVTGVSILAAALLSKRLELLRDLVAAPTALGVLLNPDNQNYAGQVVEARSAERALALPVHILEARDAAGIDAAFLEFSRRGITALLIGADALYLSQRQQLVALAARHGIPTMYDQREFALAGGLVSYGTSLSDGYRQSGRYVGRILKGGRPADLPVIQSTHFELVVNLKTAKALRLTLAPALLAAADEVIE